MSKTFKIEINRSILIDLLKHFGPDPVTDSWCVAADTLGGRNMYVREDGGEKRVRLTDRRLQAGLRALALYSPRIFAKVLDHDQHDAPLADIFVQMCVFNEERYS